jgi:hypothetical protein
MTQTKHAIAHGRTAGIGLALAFGMALALGGCATPADPKAMVISSEPAAKPFPAKLQHAMCVRAVTGGEATNPLWVSKVDDAGFHTALANSLDGAGLTATADGCHYPVDVNLLGLSQPSVGFDMTVTSHVNYKVYDAGGQPVLLETINAPFTATMGDSVIGIVRLKMANEGSIRASIQQFFDKLRVLDPQQTPATSVAPAPTTAPTTMR